jgi:hypothetical protein
MQLLRMSPVKPEALPAGTYDVARLLVVAKHTLAQLPMTSRSNKQLNR